MKQDEFIKLKMKFDSSDVDNKIDIYVNAEDLSQDQYLMLLRSFPPNELDKLEAAL